MDDKISVVIAAYKVDLLERSIESVLKQSYENIELIIINDHSPDCVDECVCKFDDPRIRYYVLNKNAGQSYVRNLGAGLATGDYVAYQDDDDYWELDKLEKQMVMLKSDNYDFCFCAFERGGEVFVNKNLDVNDLYRSILRQPMMTTATLICKKDVLLEVGGFDPGMHNIEDYPLSLKLSKNYRGAYIEEVLLHQGICGRHVSGDDNCDEALRVRCLLFKDYWVDINRFGFEEEWVNGLERFRPYCESFVYEYEMSQIEDFRNKRLKEKKFIAKDNKDIVINLCNEIVKAGVSFKSESKVLEKKPQKCDDYSISDQGVSNEELINIFTEKVLPSCMNFSNTGFMGFPDAGNSIGGTLGALMSDFLQQNLINETYCAPVATMMEIEVINTLRAVTGFEVNLNPTKIQDVGGIITYGGTGSNVTAMLLAREQFQARVDDEVEKNDYYVLIPKGIGHYSIGSSLRWLGSGHLVEVETEGYRYNIDSLKKELLERKGKVAAVVAYAGDSRTMTIEHLDEIVSLVKGIDEDIWCHADACHGFSLMFSDNLKYKMRGIERFDSMSCDPHKVLALPYCCSALLLRDADKFNLISAEADLIMDEAFAFGKITPFIGSKSWVSLKLWSVMKSLGISGIGEMIDKRKHMADIFASKLKATGNFAIINSIDFNSVVFMWKKGVDQNDTEQLNCVNKMIYNKLKEEGKIYLHQFPIRNLSDSLKYGETYYVLRYMSGNINLTEEEIDEYIQYVSSIAEECCDIIKR